MRQNWEISAAKAPFATFMPLHFTIYDSQLQKTLKVFCTQPQQRGTWTQPFHGDLQRLSCKAHKNHAQRLHKLQLQNRISMPKRKDDDFAALFKRNFKGKSPAPKWEKIAAKAPFATFMLPLQCDLRLSAGKYYACTRSSEPWRSHSTAICRDWVAKHDRITHNSYANCSSKTGSRRPSGKTTILKNF